MRGAQAPPHPRNEAGAAAGLTLADFIPLYLERHGATVRPRTIQGLRERLRSAVAAFGSVPLRDLENCFMGTTGLEPVTPAL